MILKKLKEKKNKLKVIMICYSLEQPIQIGIY